MRIYRLGHIYLTSTCVFLWTFEDIRVARDEGVRIETPRKIGRENIPRIDDHIRIVKLSTRSSGRRRGDYCGDSAASHQLPLSALSPTSALRRD